MEFLLEPVTEVDSQQFCVQIMKRLDIQRRNEHLCDVILEVGEDQARLKAHRNVLCAASPFFYNALNTEMKEKEEGVIRLKDTSKALMEEVLEYLYTGYVDINDNNAFELMAVANYFLITSLKLLSSKFIQDTLCASNSIMAYYSSVKYQCSDLREAAKSFILANFMAVSKSDDFLNLNLEQVEEWISSDEIVIKGEKEVFMAILIWTEHNTERKQSFYKLFRHVRCHYVSRSFLTTVILQHEFVRGRKECLDLVVDAMKELSDETGAQFWKHSPRKCLNTPDDAVFVCGGENGENVLCYLPFQRRWYNLKDIPSRRKPNAFASTTCQGRLYVIGGNLIPFGGVPAQCYDPLLDVWSSINSFPEGLNFTAAVSFQGLVYVIGGENNSGNRLRTVKQYDPSTNLWQEVSPLSNARSSVCVVADESYIYAIGGYTSSPSEKCLDIVERFDPKFDSWNRIAPTQAKRRGAAGVSLRNKIFVFGGVDLSGGCPCEVYDKETNVWTAIANDIAPRYYASAVCIKGIIFVVGKFGVNQNDSQRETLQVYDVEKNEWRLCLKLANKCYKVSAGKILKQE
ncbi:hypothetical protein ABFA07_003168 [Porites harrisoni]